MLLSLWPCTKDKLQVWHILYSANPATPVQQTFLLRFCSRIFGLKRELYNEREWYNEVLEKSKILLNEISAVHRSDEMKENDLGRACNVHHSYEKCTWEAEETWRKRSACVDWKVICRLIWMWNGFVRWGYVRGRSVNTLIGFRVALG